MTAAPQANAAPAQEEKKQNDKEFNFRQQEAKYERQLAQGSAKIADLERQIQELSKKQSHEDESSDEPYVDEKRLEKKLARFGEKAKQETQNDIQRAVFTAIEEERKQNWLKSNSDFYDVMQHAEKDPELAETILKMPDGFERQKLVYRSIKAMGLDKPEQKKASIQETIDANKKNLYYQPSGLGTAPYAMAGDFSPTGQKSAYDKMQELKKRLRI